MFCEIFCALYFHFSFHRNELKFVKYFNCWHLWELNVFSTIMIAYTNITFTKFYECMKPQDCNFHKIDQDSFLHITHTYFSTMNNLFMQNVYFLSSKCIPVIVFDMLNTSAWLTCCLESQHAMGTYVTNSL